MRRGIFTLLLVFLVAACGGGGGPAPGEGPAGTGPAGLSGPAQVITLAGNGEVGTTEGPALEASFNEPVELVVDEEGNVYVAEYRGARVSKVSPDGMVVTVVGGRTGDVDGPQEQARLGTPRGIVLAGDGNLYVSDWDNKSLRRVALDGTVTTIFKGSFMETLALTPDDDILASMGPDREQIVRFTLGGEIIPVAGSPRQGGYKDGPAAEAQFTLVSGLAVDQLGQVYVTEAVSLRSRGGNQLIRVVSPDGEVSTLTGRRFVTGYKDGPVGEATFHHPVDIEVDAAGNLYVADSLNHCIRRISPDGMVSILAGRCGYAGYVDGLAEEAEFNLPQGLALDAEGNIYVADTRNHRIRKIIFE